MSLLFDPCQELLNVLIKFGRDKRNFIVSFPQHRFEILEVSELLFVFLQTDCVLVTYVFKQLDPFVQSVKLLESA